MIPEVEVGRRSALNLIRRYSYPCLAPASWVEILNSMITKNSGLIFTATKIGLASMTLLCLNDSGVTQPPPLQAQIPIDAQARSKDKVLFVNPDVEDETIGDGSERAPFKTITQALQVAQPNNVIVLASGTYSTSSGETFPLMLKPGVSIQGDPRTRGDNIVIQGGGTFLSPTFARQNITILGANQAGLTGVTVSNPNPRGYGLWIESSSPIVIDNTFTGNSHDGISMTGNSAPTIRNNYFYENGANGMTIYGTSQPEVRENVFEKTGFGINIAQKAAPMLIGNRITHNRAGIVAQANARPILRDNVIEGNTEDGVVAIATSQPNLGTTTEPGGNVFRQNGRYDINSSASSQVIPAFGNQLANARTAGSVDLAGSSPVAINSNQFPSNPQLPGNPPPANTNNEAKKIPAVLQPKPAELSQPAAEEVRATPTMTPIDIPVPPPVSTEQVPQTPSSAPQTVTFLQINPNQSEDSDSNHGNTQVAPASTSDTTMEISVPPTASQPVGAPSLQIGGTAQSLPVLQPAPIIASDLLPVPGPNIPIGNTRKLAPVAVPESSRFPSSGSSPQPPNRATSMGGLRYRVVVEAESKSKQALVRSLIPGAFRTFADGRMKMQAGIFSDRANADEVLQILNSKGLRATIEQMQ